MSLQTLLIVDDDPMIGEALSAGLERPGRRIIVCRDVESAQIVVENQVITDIVTDVKLTGAFRFEGLDFLAHVRRHAPAARVILITGHVPEGLANEAKLLGAVAVLTKPFSIETLEAYLSPVEGHGAAALSFVPTMQEIVSSVELRPRFQPIVHVSDGSILGFESLASLRFSSPLQSPEAMFSYAERKESVGLLEAACVDRTLRDAVRLPAGSALFINAHPVALAEPAFVPMLEQTALRFGFDLSRLVVEITEQQPLRDEPPVFVALEQLRARGVRFAFDDVGIAYSHLPLIERIRPSFLKISQQFGTLFEADPTRAKIVRNLLTLGRDFGCDVILEGVEDVSTAEEALAIGIPFAQGYLFGRPADVDTFTSLLGHSATDAATRQRM